MSKPSIRALHLAAIAVAVLASSSEALAYGDGDLLSATGVPPNVMLFVDSSGSMATNDVGGQARIYVARDTFKGLVSAVNPPDGSGGFEENVRFGLSRFPGGDKGGRWSSHPYYAGCVGANVLEPFESGNEQAILDALDLMASRIEVDSRSGDGTCLSEALLDLGHYFAGEGFTSYGYPAVTAERTTAGWFEPRSSIGSNSRRTDTMEPLCAETAYTGSRPSPAAGDCDSPMDLSCRSNFVILMTDGLHNDDGHDHWGAQVTDPDEAHRAFLSKVGNADGDANECNTVEADAADCIAHPVTGRDDGTDWGSSEGAPNNTDWLDDVAWYLRNTDLKSGVSGDQNIVTYTIGFKVDNVLLQEAADNGGGEYYTADTASELTAALTEAIDDIFDQKTAGFSGVSVPGGSIGAGNALFNTFFTTQDDVMWEGHLEALRIDSTGQILDANGNAATDSNGVLLSTRVPYWDAADRLAPTVAAANARRLISSKASETPPAPIDLEDAVFSADYWGMQDSHAPNYINAANSTINTKAEIRTAVNLFRRGLDGFDEDNDAAVSDASELRPAGRPLGDIWHSNPTAVGTPTRRFISEPSFASFYTTYKERNRVIYAGSNTPGFLHGFDAGMWVAGDNSSTSELEDGYYSYGIDDQTGLPNDAEGGDELFGWYPENTRDRYKWPGLTTKNRTQVVDGPITVADAWLGADSANKTADEWATVMIVGSQDRSMMAFDITDPEADQVSDDHGIYPKWLWNFTDGGISPTLTDGLVSKPVITKVKLRSSSGGDACGPDDGDGNCQERWVAIFGTYSSSSDPARTDLFRVPSDADFDEKGLSVWMVALDTGETLGLLRYNATESQNNHSDMIFAFPSEPAAIDVDFDGYADVVYIGDLGGQLWKWDISGVGVDTSGSDGIMDTWPSEIWFKTPKAVVAGPADHYRSFWNPPAAAYVDGVLTLAWGSAERNDLFYAGDSSVDDNNRFYVAQDPHPVSGAASVATPVFPSTPLSESNLTDITSLAADNDASDSGFYFTLPEGEKAITKITIFAGQVIAATFSPASVGTTCQAGSGSSNLYIFSLDNGTGGYPDAMAASVAEERFTDTGAGLPSDPTVVVSDDPSNDKILIKTSDGPRILALDAPDRDPSGGTLIYWRQRF